ncbi:MAG: hypothetical protein ABFD97_15545 [Syntrophobacter sp.]
MNEGCFYLTRLTLKGPDIPDAEIQFRRGLNVIYGPSNTGKSFIAQCVDFMFGSSRPPKEIPEAASYDTVSLRLSTGHVSNELILERSLRGGDFLLRSNGMEDRILGAKHQPGNEETVSHFLLSSSGLVNKKVRMNQQGKTRALSFRDIARLVVVDETSVITELSPIFSGQLQWRTVENSVFRLLLTGIDDSSVIAREDPKIAKGRREGQSEVLEALLGKAMAQVTDLEIKGEEKELRDQLTRLESSFEASSQALATEQQTASGLEDVRREAWGHLHTIDSRLVVLAELQKRFVLLEQQYGSDLRRLEAISEASFRLDQMKEERCSVCGALAEHHDVQHKSPHASIEDVANSYSAEAKKITVLLADLQGTLHANNNEIENLGLERQKQHEALKEVTAQLEEILQPRIQTALQNLRECQTQRDKVKRAVELFEYIRELEGLHREIENAPKRERAEGPSSSVGADEAEDFSREVEALLRSWHFPNLGRVTFSEEDQDMVISGQRRASHGKGVRAITHAAFNLALLQYCLRASKPHPGLVLIDSPLIVYRQPDAGEERFTPDVKQGFYRTLADEFTTAQVIILENDAPPEDLLNIINGIEFTGSDQGRRGFLPGINQST